MYEKREWGQLVRLFSVMTFSKKRSPELDYAFDQLNKASHNYQHIILEHILVFYRNRLILKLCAI